MTDTCGGQCCAVFTLKTPIEEFYGEQVVEMAIPLTDQEAVDRRERFGGGLTLSTDDGPWKYHTCKHWDEETRLCGIYEDRPVMCRDYPYEKPCDVDGCCYRPPEDVIAKWKEMRERRAAEAAQAQT